MKNILVHDSFGNLCRICSCKDDTGSLVPIFGSDHDLLEKITVSLPITIHEGDSLPHQICKNCLSVVEKSYELIKRAQSSETFFLNCLTGPIQIKVEEECSIIESEDKSKNNVPPISLDLDGSFQCDLCGLQLSESFELNQHIQEKHTNQSAPPNTEFTVNKICSLCGQLFECEETYMLHKCESQHKCTRCNKVMPTKCLLNRHIQHSCKQLFYCPHCHKTFSVKVSFMKHIQAHTGEECLSDCLACEKNQQGPGEIVEHTCNLNMEDISTSAKKYRCYICGQGYKRQINLAKHCLQHEPKTKWKFKCHKCEDVFEKEKTLHSHYEKVHKMPRTWVCRFCGKALSTKLSVQIHERIHTQVKPYVCEWCGNAFRCKANLIQHHAMHTGIRRHVCPVCGKKFSRPFFLKTHLRVHTGERPYKCEICDQRFTQVTDMKRHRKRHDKPLTRNSRRSVSRFSQPKVKNVSQPTENECEETVIIDSQPTLIFIRGTEEELQEIEFDSFPIETVELKVETSYE